MIDAAEKSGGDGDAAAGGPRHDGESLGGADGEGVAGGDIAEVLVAAAELLGGDHDQGDANEHSRDEIGVAPGRFRFVAERERHACEACAHRLVAVAGGDEPEPARSQLEGYRCEFVEQRIELPQHSRKASARARRHSRGPSSIPPSGVSM